MRIAQLVSNYHPTNPLASKAIYSHVGSLSEGLQHLGHEVHLFGATDSVTNTILHSIGPALSQVELPDDIRKYYMFEHASRCYEFARNNVDIIHSHFTIISSFFNNLIDVPTVVSVHSPIEDRVRSILELHKNNRYISFSLAQRKQMPNLNWYANIYHGVDTNIFAFEPEPEKYLVFLGRITQDKGTTFAIEAAKATGIPLLIAGASYPEEGYWQKYVEPHIDGKSIRYVGEMPFYKKIQLLQKAKALLFPSNVSEVFGYSMIEAMSCGTPVIGFDNGSVLEIVRHGETGFVVNDVDGMIDAIRHINDIDRTKVRKRAEMYFSLDKMVAGYEKIYRRILSDREFQDSKSK
ncbi:MAG: hypothetical protein A2655_00725 [Candidatus Yanofskybacteria bacterium RIFCSPHIGHO2_01_FULL_43_42]|uniref:Glycosyl transferase n=1 Tax=Candidatus Yanofskybacteria bacterium RIFCSPLOWO2_01_FULL_43_22 TaxID=1802695 RepID=A0A1F8GHC1_9BACT|nr:MAG: hypothetical protein A2655_00725 [Candidatus Yanofskybacteria bacterium RIFCSPHIGHO2_01_FULL_43_42]OGN13434.1 MAG: hypothetical protein A3D48_01050 [Candidatus Yanofskybacteria bacterium RIFCSPHIGHO2_02_FULL_43_17]OGN24805.1 MAG: hypothetical protein A3A13_04690 [Candidatus Yanofskybacteria bacterium RIFCSPLOWO2_01_FULL_43_22]